MNRRAAVFIGIVSLLSIALLFAMGGPERAQESDHFATTAITTPFAASTLNQAVNDEAGMTPAAAAFPAPFPLRAAGTDPEVSAPPPVTSMMGGGSADGAQKASSDGPECAFVSAEEWARYLDIVRKATRDGDWDPLLALSSDTLGSRLCNTEGKSFELFSATFPRMPRELIERLLAQGFMVAPRHLPRAASAGKELLELFIGTGVSYEEPAIRDGMIRAFILKNDPDGLAYLGTLGIDLSDPLGEKRWFNMALKLSQNADQVESLKVLGLLQRHGAVLEPSEFDEMSADARRHFSNMLERMARGAQPGRE